jgi:hypothetical protein
VSAPVDVLAVLDAVDGILNSPVAVRRAELVRQQAAIREARAAVAELIEAAAVTLAEPWEIDRLRAALARVQGGAA